MNLIYWALPPSPHRYNTEGHLINVTYPTGEVISFHGNMEKSVKVEVDTSNSENFTTATNFSATKTIYTLRQGMYASGFLSCLFKHHGLTHDK